MRNTLTNGDNRTTKYITNGHVYIQSDMPILRENKNDFFLSTPHYFYENFF